jgi:lysophospholipase L1-like esterase
MGGSSLDIGRARDYWSVPRGAPHGLVYVALGDSLAQGLGASRPDLGYVGLLARRLGDARVVNLSVSGARVRDVLDDQLPALAMLPHIDVVTLDVGGNDVRDFDPSRFAPDVWELMSRLPAGTVVADIPYFMHGHWERDAQEASRLLQTAAAAHGIPVVPIHEVLRRRGWRGMFGDYAADFFHPNDRGHQIWADAFWSVLGQRR